jgi:hypothetical protein
MSREGGTGLHGVAQPHSPALHKVASQAVQAQPGCTTVLPPGGSTYIMACHVGFVSKIGGHESLT